MVLHQVCREPKVQGEMPSCCMQQLQNKWTQQLARKKKDAPEAVKTGIAAIYKLVPQTSRVVHLGVRMGCI